MVMMMAAERLQRRRLQWHSVRLMRRHGGQRRWLLLQQNGAGASVRSVGGDHVRQRDLHGQSGVVAGGDLLVSTNHCLDMNSTSHQMRVELT